MADSKGYIQRGSLVKNPLANARDEEDTGSVPRREYPLKQEMETHTSIHVWMNPLDRGAWQTIVHAVAKSWTQLSN